MIRRLAQEFALIAAMLATGAHAQGAGEGAGAAAAAPEFVPVINVSLNLDASPDRGPDGERLLRRPRVSRNEVSAQDYPPQLLEGVGQRTSFAAVTVSLDQTGAVTACKPQKLTVWNRDRTRQELDLPPQLAEQTCALARTRVGYLHALDTGAQPVAAQVVVTVAYAYTSAGPAAPSPPAPRFSPSFIPSVNGWPPRHFDARNYGAVQWRLPDLSTILAPDPKRPRRARVDVLLKSDREGTITSCRVAVPSGIADYDDASCRALASERQRPYLSDYPLRLYWDGSAVALQPPQTPVGPELIGQVTPIAAMVAGIELPRLADVTVELRVSPKGRLLHCEVSWSSFNDALDARSCALFGKDTRFTPPVSVFGEKVEGILRMRIDWNALTARRDWY